MVSKAEAEARLKRVGAFRLCRADDVHEIWGTAWGFEIWVPIANGGVHDEDMDEIIQDIIDSKPQWRGMIP